jgi:NADPH:quinone reductase-like Zn-dependent oxidoreductase
MDVLIDLYIGQELFRMHAQGLLSAVICATYPLDQVPRALNRLKQRQTFGKVIIHPQKLSAGVSSKL